MVKPRVRYIQKRFANVRPDGSLTAGPVTWCFTLRAALMLRPYLIREAA